MSQTLQLEIPDDVYQALEEHARSLEKAPEQLALEWLQEHACQPVRGSVDAIMPYFGAWKLTPEERAEIERAIYEDRHREEEDV